MTCEKCGHALAVGDFPFCPHGRGVSAVEQDEIPGGQWFENGFDTPQKFYSHSEHRAALAARGLEIRAKWAGPNDRHMTRWDAPSQKTLDDARVLLERGPQMRRERAARLQADFPITVTEMTPDEVYHR